VGNTSKGVGNTLQPAENIRQQNYRVNQCNANIIANVPFKSKATRAGFLVNFTYLGNSWFWSSGAALGVMIDKEGPLS
jgi:hypothetical protein